MSQKDKSSLLSSHIEAMRILISKKKEKKNINIISIIIQIGINICKIKNINPKLD